MLGGATLFASLLFCVAAGIVDLRPHQFLGLWSSLGSSLVTGGFITTIVLAFACCMGNRRDRQRYEELTRRLAESTDAVRELRVELGLVQAEGQLAQTALNAISDAIPLIESSDATPTDDVPVVGAISSHHAPTVDLSRGAVATRRELAEEKELSEVKNEFVSMVSHELRTPLACIKAYVEMLIDGEAEDPKTQHDFYEVIQNEANRLGRLIDNILTISRIEAGLALSNRQPEDLAAIINNAIEVIRPQIVEKNITLTTRVELSSYRTRVDRDMLFHALLNLLSNAVKYTPDGRSINVEAGIDLNRKTVFTKIIDTGVGIPPKDMPYVFDKFYRAEANSRIAPGTGLGLALVRHIVETVHEGRMFAQSCVGKGSCFGFELDLCD
jgi:two-component system phosphate regulon sensor histidine kinase PhoR